MKNHFFQRGKTASVIILILCFIESFLLFTDFTLTVTERIRYGYIFAETAGIFLLTTIFAFFLLGEHTKIYVDETGICAKSFQRVLWCCSWKEMNDISVSFGRLRAVVFKITYIDGASQQKYEIEVTRKSKRILAHFCSRKDYREKILSAKTFIP